MKNGSIKKLGAYALASILSIGVAIGSSLMLTGCDELSTQTLKVDGGNDKFGNNAESFQQTESVELPTDMPAPSTISALFVSEGASAEQKMLASTYQSTINDTLNKYLKDIMINKFVSNYDPATDQVMDIRWGLYGNENTDEIEKIQIHFTCARGYDEGLHEYHVDTVIPESPITLSDLYTANDERLKAAFDSSTAFYIRDTVFSYFHDVQSERAALAQTIAEVTNNDAPSQIVYISESNYYNDEELGRACIYFMMAVNDERQSYAGIGIAESSNSATDEELMQNLRDGKYKIFESEIIEYSDYIIVDEQSQVENSDTENDSPTLQVSKKQDPTEYEIEI